jgi:hypothetical protein
MNETFFSTNGRFGKSGGEPRREGRLETLKFRTRTMNQSVTSDSQLGDTEESTSSPHYEEDRHKPSTMESPIYDHEGQDQPSWGDKGVAVDKMA